jgi:TolA-binding protein
MNKTKIFGPVVWLAACSWLASCTTSLSMQGKPESTDNVKTLKSAPSGKPTTAPVDLPAEKATDEDAQRQIDQLKGELESLKFQSEQKEKDLQAQIALLVSENGKLKEELVAATKNAPKPETTGKSSEETAKLLWDSGVAAVMKNDKSRAADSFKSLVDSYPKNEHAHSAMVGLGMINYAQQDYKEAALRFNAAIEKYPKKRNGVSLVEFGLAVSVHQLGDKDNAKLFFEELIRKYPKSPAALQAKQILAKKAKVPEDLFQIFPNWLDMIR